MAKRHILIASVLGLGFSRIAPGTVGALGGYAIAILLKQFTSCPDLLLAGLIVLFFLLGVDSSSKLEAKWGKDSSKIVIDEVVGMWIALLLLPSAWLYTILAFVLFRFFDIIKPFFIKKMEKLKGGWGVMMDDVLAGIYANLVIQLINLSALLIHVKC